MWRGWIHRWTHVLSHHVLNAYNLSSYWKGTLVHRQTPLYDIIFWWRIGSELIITLIWELWRPRSICSSPFCTFFRCWQRCKKIADNIQDLSKGFSYCMQDVKLITVITWEPAELGFSYTVTFVICEDEIRISRLFLCQAPKSVRRIFMILEQLWSVLLPICQGCYTHKFPKCSKDGWLRCHGNDI